MTNKKADVKETIWVFCYIKKKPISFAAIEWCSHLRMAQKCFCLRNQHIQCLLLSLCNQIATCWVECWGRIYSHCAGSALGASNVLAGGRLLLYSNMGIKSADRHEAMDTQPLTFGRGWSWAGWRAARAAGTAESSSCWSSTPWRPPRYHCSILSKSGGLGNTWKSREETEEPECFRLWWIHTRRAVMLPGRPLAGRSGCI